MEEQQQKNSSFALSEFTIEDIKKLKEFVGRDFERIQKIHSENDDYKRLAFNEEEILNIKNALKKTGADEAETLSAKLPKYFDPVDYVDYVDAEAQKRKAVLKEQNDLFEKLVASLEKGKNLFDPGTDEFVLICKFLEKRYEFFFEEMDDVGKQRTLSERLKIFSDSILEFFLGDRGIRERHDRLSFFENILKIINAIVEKIFGKEMDYFAEKSKEKGVLDGRITFFGEVIRGCEKIQDLVPEDSSIYKINDNLLRIPSNEN